MTIIVATAAESRASAFVRECRPHLAAVRWRTGGVAADARPDLVVLLGNEAGVLPPRGSPAADPVPLLWVPDRATARFARDFTRQVQRLGFALLLSRPWRSDPGLAKVTELIVAGTVGGVCRLSLSGAWRAAAADELSASVAPPWRLHPLLDLARWLLAEERAVPAIDLQAAPPTLLLDWGGDRHCEVAMPHDPHEVCGFRIVVVGDSGNLSYAVGDAEVVVQMPPSARPGVEATLRRPVASGCAAAIEVGFLLNAVRRGQPLPALTPNASAREFEIVDAVSLNYSPWRA